MTFIADTFDIDNMAPSPEEVEPSAADLQAAKKLFFEITGQEFGEDYGHPFRGNQYTNGTGIKDSNPDKPGTQAVGHHATDATSAHWIDQTGFDPMATGGAGSMFGKGTYFSIDSPSGRQTQLQMGGEHFTAEVSLGKSFVLRGEDVYGGKHNIARYMGDSEEGFSKRVEKFEGDEKTYPNAAAYALADLAKEKGYDSIVVRSSTTENADIYGVDQIVVFDKSQIEIKEHLGDTEWTKKYIYSMDKNPPTVRGSLSGSADVELVSLPEFMRRLGFSAVTASIPLELGDSEGHPFHGNQWTGPLSDHVRNEGGMTVDQHGDSPTTGFIVAKADIPSTFIPAKEFLNSEAKAKAALSRFLDEHAAEYDDPDSMIGIWHDDANGEVVLDVVEKFDNKDEAVQAGVDRNQQAIWDVDAEEPIDTGGTGK